jgi:RHS repeat-associated protein
MMTDDQGMIVWEAGYKPFGEVSINSKSEVVNNFRFPGQYYDEETGLHYNYHRYYDPKTGRYLRPDPIRLEGGVNLYTYVLNNPINIIDPEGLFILAFCHYTSGGEGVGAGVLECELSESLCLGGKRHTAEYFAILGGITGGSPVGKTYFSLTFEKADDVRTLGGDAEIAITSVALGIGVSWGQTCLGAGCDYGWSPQLGIDLSANVFEGYGWVYEIKEEECICD